MSARKLTPVEEDVLALGLNFAVVPSMIPKEEIVQRLEPKLYHLKNDAACNICVQVTEVLRRARLPRSHLSKNQKDAVRNLRTDKSIHTVLSRNKLTLRLRFGLGCGSVAFRLRLGRGSVAVRLRFGCGWVEVNRWEPQLTVRSNRT